MQEIIERAMIQRVMEPYQRRIQELEAKLSIVQKTNRILNDEFFRLRHVFAPLGPDANTLPIRRDFNTNTVRLGSEQEAQYRALSYWRRLTWRKKWGVKENQIILVDHA